MDAQPKRTGGHRDASCEDVEAGFDVTGGAGRCVVVSRCAPLDQAIGPNWRPVPSSAENGRDSLPGSSRGKDDSPIPRTRCGLHPFESQCEPQWRKHINRDAERMDYARGGAVQDRLGPSVVHSRPAVRWLTAALVRGREGASGLHQYPCRLRTRRNRRTPGGNTWSWTPGHQDPVTRISWETLTHIQVVRVNWGDHACVTLFSPTARFCGTWFEIAINTLIRLGDVDPQVGQRAVEAVEEVVRASPRTPSPVRLPVWARERTNSHSLGCRSVGGTFSVHERTTPRFASINC